MDNNSTISPNNNIKRSLINPASPCCQVPLIAVVLYLVHSKQHPPLHLLTLSHRLDPVPDPPLDPPLVGPAQEEKNKDLLVAGTPWMTQS